MKLHSTSELPSVSRRGFAAVLVAASVAAVCATGAPALATTTKLGCAMSTTLGPSTIVAGTPVTVTATLKKLNGTAIAGRALKLYQRPAGAAAYTLWGTATTSSTGLAKWTPHPILNTTYQVRFLGDATYVAINGPALGMHVAPRITANPATVTIAKGASSTISGSVYPARPGATLTLQKVVSGVWTNAGTAKLSSTSTYALSVTPTGSGTTAYRLTLPADATHVAGASPTAFVVVS